MKVILDGRQAAAAYSEAFKRLRALPGFNQREVLRGEAGSILKAWAGKVKVATADQIERRMRSSVGKRMGIQSAGGNNPYGITVDTGVRGGHRGEVWFRTRNQKFQQAGQINDAGTFVPAWKHYRAQDWAKINYGGAEYAAQLRARRILTQRSASLARQSIVQIADQLGIDLTQVKGQGISAAGVGKARAAIAANGQSYQNGFGYQGGDGVKDYVQLLTRLPYGFRAATDSGQGLDKALIAVLAGRAKFIERSYEKGVFDSLKNSARAFPNLVTVSGLRLAA